VLYLSGSTLKTMFNLRNDVAAHEGKLNYLKNQNDDLECKLNWLQTRDDYVKYLARKKLGLVEPGEVKLYITENELQN
jgi:cell division protein FtsB